jgi:hypothetical protein
LKNLHSTLHLIAVIEAVSEFVSESVVVMSGTKGSVAGTQPKNDIRHSHHTFRHSSTD